MYKMAAMGGDGIWPEVVQADGQVLKVCAERDDRFTLDLQDFDWGLATTMECRLGPEPGAPHRDFDEVLEVLG